jgi:hypothetical protein
MAIRTVPPGAEKDLQQAETSSYWKGLWHQVATGATGLAGGFFGLPGLAVELPLTTGLIFRSIAAIADDFGEDLSKPETRLECLTLFSYGSPSPEDNAAESTYLATRLGLAVFVTQGAQLMTRAGAEELANAVTRGLAPPLAQLVGRVASRFNVAVAQKVVAQSVSVVGAAGGAFLNVAFTDHFNNVARYHFGIRKLERKYGAEAVQAFYLGEVRRLAAAKLPPLRLET